MSSIRTFAFAAILGAALAVQPALAFDPASAREVNLDGQGLALGGYDPVAYFTLGKPVKGAESIVETYNGSRYIFADEEDRALFAKSPGKYVPEFGGFCSYAAAKGYKADADPQAWKIVGGKLYLNYNKEVATTWQADIPGYIHKAEANWPKISSKAPKDF